MQGETMVSETVLGVLFCFFLPLAVAARFWHWYTFFKRSQKIKLAKQMTTDETDLVP
jgi:cytochrome bd-type quinol oxidase subunit 2